MIPVAESEHEQAKEHLKDLLALEAGLTPWEEEFVEKMSHIHSRLSRGQVDKIFEIYRVRC